MDEELDDIGRSLLALLGGAAGLVLLLWWVASAPASPICLTKAEARKLWPTQHIYWYSKDHCWSNRRGGPPSGLRINRAMAQEVTPQIAATTTRSEKQDRLPLAKRAREVVKIVPMHEYNEIDALADQDPFFNAQPLPMWPSITPFIPWQQRIAGAFN